MQVQIEGDFKRIDLVGELTTRYDSRASFYGKAKVYRDEDEEGVYYLMSYSTIVSESRHGVVKHYGKWSQTTTRHQKEFEKQFSR